MKNILMFIVLVGSLQCIMAAEQLVVDVKSSEQDGHHLLDLRAAVNSSCFDDGIADNGKGGWTDEGTNDFYVYPAIDFAAQVYRGYVFDFVDPEKNAGKNILLLGHNKTFADVKKSVRLQGLALKGKNIYMMHSEGRITDKNSTGRFTVIYDDGTKVSEDLRMGKELSNWYQGQWWNCYEQPNKDAPEIVKESQCNPDAYKKLGGKNFNQDILQHATAKRWPVIQAVNGVSKNWSIPVCFWSYMFKNPHPDKHIQAIEISNDGGCLMAVAAITVSDTDFSLLRQGEIGKMRKPANAPADYFTAREQSLSSGLTDILAEQKWTKGIRDVQQRSDSIITVR
ncbi:MAG: hypothetical protein HRU15_17425, partial [Planctomycetes bacterium]|nr:hypothetical protein [Planctomycetota bacterium]